MTFVAHGGAIIGVVATSSSCREVLLLHADIDTVADAIDLDTKHDALSEIFGVIGNALELPCETGLEHKTTNSPNSSPKSNAPLVVTAPRKSGNHDRENHVQPEQISPFYSYYRPPSPSEDPMSPLMSQPTFNTYPLDVLVVSKLIQTTF